MPERVVPGPVEDTAGIREAVCIHTKKIFDSCRSKDCIEDLRLYPTQKSQFAIDRALSVRACAAELIYTYIDVQPVSFDRGYFTVDVRYFYRVTADAFVGAARPVEVSGLAIFDKRSILFGSESGAKLFSSEDTAECCDCCVCAGSDLPVAAVEAVDPVVLGIKLVEVCDCRPCECEPTEIPECIAACFGNELVFGGDGKRIYVTLGQFSILRLERDTQLLIPIYDYCVPDKECACGTGSAGAEEDPCEIFRRIRFPMDEFFPPNTFTTDND